MSSIDERVVQMEFDNDQFEKGIKQSIKSLDEFKKSLKLEDATKSLSNLEKASGKISLQPLVDAAETVKNRFSDLGVVGMVALERIANTAINVGHRVVNELITPMRTGFAEYETQINSVQTILSNTRSKGTTLDQVNAALDELNHYADLTIYNFTEMTRNIGTFTAAGVDLDTSVSAIKGIANLAAVSGSTSEQASRAMYQLSQALSSGTVRLMDWNSVVNAGMGGEVFKDALMETARVHGIAIDDMIKKEGSFRETLQKGWLSSEILLETLNKFTGDLNKEQLLAIGYTEQQAQAILEMGDDANKAATKVKTFTQLFDTLAEAAQSGWTQSWEIIIGDFEEARELLTGISDALSDIINKRSEARNSMLEQVFGTKDGGKAIDSSKWEAFSTGYDKADQFKERIIEVARAHGIAIDDMIAAEGSFEETLKNGWLTSDLLKESMQNVNASAEQQATSLEEYQRIVAEIWNGQWGNGEDRFSRLAEAGYDYAFVQQLVNLAGEDGVFTWDELTEEQKALISTLGESEDAFKDLRDGMNDSNSAVSELLEGTEGLTGREKIIQGFTKVWEILNKVFEDIAKVWNIVFPDNRVETLNSIIDAFFNWANALEYTSEASTAVKVIFNGLFSAIAIVVDVIKAVGAGFANFFEKLPKGNNGLLDFISNIGLLLGQFRQFLLREGTFEKVTETVTNFLMEVGGFFFAIIHDVKALFSGEELNFVWLETLKRWFEKIWNVLKKITFEPFLNFIDKAKEFFKDKGLNFEWVGSVKTNIQNGMQSIGETFSTWAESAGLDTSGPIEFIQSLFNKFIEWFTNLDWSIFEPVKQGFQDFWSWLTETTWDEKKETILNAISKAFDDFLAWFGLDDIQLPLISMDGVKKKFEEFWNWLTSFNVVEFGSTIFGNISDAFNGLITWFTDNDILANLNPMDNIKKTLEEFWTWLTSFNVVEFGNTIFGIISARFQDFIDWFVSVKQTDPFNALISFKDQLTETVNWFLNTASGKAAEYKGSIFDKITTAFDTFQSWASDWEFRFSFIDDMKDKIRGFVEFIKDPFGAIESTLHHNNSGQAALHARGLTASMGTGSVASEVHTIQAAVSPESGESDLSYQDTIFYKIQSVVDEFLTWFGQQDFNPVNLVKKAFEDFMTYLGKLTWPEIDVEGMKAFFGGIGEGIGSFFVGLMNALDNIDIIEKARNAVESLGNVFNPDSEFMSWIGSTTESITSTLGPMGESLGEFVHNFMGGLQEFVGDVGLKDVVSWMLSALWGLAALAAAGGIGAITGIADGIGEWFEGITGGNKMILLGQLGKGLAGIAFAVKVFTDMGFENAKQGLIDVGIAIGEFLAAEGVQALINWKSGAALIAPRLGAIGTALMGMASAALIFSQITEGERLAAIGAIGAFCSELALVMAAASGWSFGIPKDGASGKISIEKGKYSFGSGFGLIGAAAAVAIMAFIAKELSEIEFGGLILGEARVALFGTMLTAFTGLQAYFKVDIGGGLSAMGLALAVSIMGETARKLNEIEIKGETWGKLVGLTALVAVFGSLNGFGSFEKDDGTGKKWKISRVDMKSGIGSAINEMGLAQAVSIMVDAAQKIHDSDIEWEDIGKIAIFSAIISGFGVLSGLSVGGNSTESSKSGSFTKGTGGSFEQSKKVVGPGFSGNVGAALRAFGLVGAIRLMTEITKDIHNANITDHDAQVVGLFALIVAAFASLAGDGETFWVKDTNGIGMAQKTKSFKTGMSIREMLATLELVAAVGIMGEVAASLAQVEAEHGDDALLKGVAAVGAFAVIVALMSTLMTTNIGGADKAKGIGQTLTSGASMIGTMVALGEAFPKIAQGVTMLSAIDSWDPIWQGIVLLGLALGELVAAGALTSLGNVAIGVLVISAAITAIGFAIAANIDAITNFASEFRELYTSLDPDAQNGEGSLEGFFSFIEEFLGILETYAESFGEKGYDIAHKFVDGVINGFKKQLTKLKLTIGQSVVNILNTLGIYDALAPDMKEMVDFYNSLNWEEYEWALDHGWTESSGVEYYNWATELALKEQQEETDAEAEKLVQLQEEAQNADDAISNLFWTLNRDKNGNAGTYSNLSDDEKDFLDSTTERLQNQAEVMGDINNAVDLALMELANLYGLNYADVKNMYDQYIKDHSEVSESFSEVSEEASAAEKAVQGYSDALTSAESSAYVDGQKAVEDGVEAVVDTTEQALSTIDGLSQYDSTESDYAPIPFGDIFDERVNGLLEEYQEKSTEMLGSVSDKAEQTGTILEEKRAQAQQALSDVYGDLDFDSIYSSIKIDEGSKDQLEKLITDYFLPEDFDWSNTEAVLNLGNNVVTAMAAVLSDPTNFDWSALGITVDPSILGEGFTGTVQLIQDELGNLTLVPTGEDLGAGLGEGMENSTPDVAEAGVAMGEAAVEGAAEGSETHSPSEATKRIGQGLAQGLIDGVEGSTLKMKVGMFKIGTMMVSLTKEIAERMIRALRTFDDAWMEVGKNSIKGFIRGMTENNDEVLKAAKEVAQKTLDATKEQLGVQSPSKAFEEIGMYADMGLARGLTKYSGLVQQSSYNLADSSIETLRGTLSGMAAIINGEVDVNPRITPVLDLSELQNSSSRIGSMLNSRSGYLSQRANGYFTAAQFLQNAKVDAKNSDVVAAINDLNSRMDGQVEALSNLQVVMNTGALVGTLKRPLDRRLGEMAGYRERGI